MKRYVPIEGWPDLVRDNENNAIINTNSVAIQAAKLRKHQRKKSKQELEERLNSLESDVSEIKDLLKSIADKII